MKIPCIKIRWITTTCFEILLPNGKNIILDPWTGKCDLEPSMAKDTGFEVNDFFFFVYVFISHSHFDHFDILKELLELKQTDSCGGHVFIPALSARKLCDLYDVPLVDITPIYPYETMYLDDITATPLPCRHFGDKGIFVKDTPAQSVRHMQEAGYSPEAIDLMQMGTLEETDLAISVNQSNFRFMVLGGRVYRFNNIYKYCEQFQPNFVIRQVSNGATPQDYADMIARFCTPIVFPSHHDTHHLDEAQNMTFEEYFAKVNEALERKGAVTRVVNIQPLIWYSIGNYCTAEA